MSVSPNPTYASELFGEGHAAISYPDGMTPVVTLTIPRNLAVRAAVEADDATARDACPARSYDGSAEVTFTLLAGTFDGNVTGLMWDPIAGVVTGTDASRPEAAPASVATIESGGRKGDNSITIAIKEATNGSAPANGDTARSNEDTTTYQDVKACTPPATPGQTISFALPELVGLDATLSGASKAETMMKQVSLRAESRIVSGAFTDGFLTGNALNAFTTPVVMSRDAVTLSISDANAKDIVIDGDGAFTAVKQAHPVTGYVELATVTVSTRTEHVVTPASETEAESVYRISGTAPTATDPLPTTDADIHIYTAAKSQAKVALTLYGLDGEEIDAGLRGVLTVDAMGTRDLFNEDDMLFIDYDGNGMMGGSEAIAIDGDMGTGDALSVDPDTSDSFKGGVGTFKVYYMPGGKENINHEAMIKLMANVDYSDPSATDEAEKSTSTTFKFEGVGGAVMAYAIPHSANGIGDMGNVRVRCEASAGCRVFAECWDDMGNRGFGEAPKMIPGNNVMVADGAAIEAITGLDPMSRLSCRVLSKGAVTVQQLTRDGNSGTLVNNTFVGGG